MREYRIMFTKREVQKMDDLFSYFAEKMTTRFIQRSFVKIIYDFYGGYYNITITSQYINVIKEYDKQFKEFLKSYKKGGNSND